MSQGACPMLKGLTKKLPSDSLRATRSRICHEFISDARTAFSMRVWRTVQPPTPPASLPVIVWAMGVGWKQQRSFQPHVLCSTILISRIQFANSRNLNSNSTYHPTVVRWAVTVGNRCCSASLHIMGECWHPFSLSGELGNVSKSVATSFRRYG